MYGPGHLVEFLSSTDSSSRKRAAQQSPGDGDEFDNGPDLQSNETQRVCVCESQFWDQVAGCFACYKKHGSLELEGTIPESLLSSASSTYCAASATASVGLADFLYNIALGVTPTATGSATGTETASVKYADPIGNKTEVSYYYTQAVTGTAAWSLVQPTGSADSASYTTTNVQDGQIRPTISTSATRSANASGTDSSNPTQSGKAAGRYEAVGAAGLLGLAGLVAFL